MFKKRNPGNCLVTNCGCTPAVTNITCSPCNIPLKDLAGTGFLICAGTSSPTLSYPFALTWNGLTTNAGSRWDSGCVALPCARQVANPTVHNDAAYARHVLSCTPGVAARLVVTFFRNATDCAAGTNLLATGTYIAPSGGTGEDGGSTTLASIGDCSFFDLQAKEGVVQRFVISE